MATESNRTTESQRPDQTRSGAVVVSPPPSTYTPPPGLALSLFAMLTAGIVTAGWFYYQNIAQHYRAEAERQLSAIADLKVGELTQWRKERLADGSILFKNASISALVRRFLENPEDADAERQIQVWFERYGTHFRHDEIRLLDSQRVSRLSWPAGL